MDDADNETRTTDHGESMIREAIGVLAAKGIQGRELGRDIPHRSLHCRLSNAFKHRGRLLGSVSSMFGNNFKVELRVDLSTISYPRRRSMRLSPCSALCSALPCLCLAW